MDDDINPTIRSMAIEVMDDIINRPIGKLFFDKENPSESPFEQIKLSLQTKSIKRLIEWKVAVDSVLDNEKYKEVKHLKHVLTMLRNYFEKKYCYIEKLNDYKFKDLLDMLVHDYQSVTGLNVGE